MFQRSMLKSAVIAAGIFAVVPSFAAEYSVDKAHSNVGFSIRHMMSKVPGSFKDYEGTFSFDEKKAKDAKVQFTINTASVDTANADRDKHLRSPDFFNAEKNPTITFVSKKVTPAGGKKYKIEGDMTMLGKTLPVTFNAEFLGTQKDPYGNMKAGFNATGKINRKDFGMSWNKTLDAGSLILGDEVAINLDIEAAQKKPEAAPAPAAAAAAGAPAASEKK